MQPKSSPSSPSPRAPEPPSPHLASLTNYYWLYCNTHFPTPQPSPAQPSTHSLTTHPPPLSPLHTCTRTAPHRTQPKRRRLLLPPPAPPPRQSRQSPPLYCSIPPPPSVFTTLTVLLPTVTQFLVRPQEIRSRLWHPIPRLGPNRSFQTRRPCIPCSASALPPSPPPETQHQLLFAITTHASIHFDIVFMIERIPQSDSWVAVCWNPRICSNVILY